MSTKIIHFKYIFIAPHFYLQTTICTHIHIIISLHHIYLLSTLSIHSIFYLVTTICTDTYISISIKIQSLLVRE